MIVEAPELSQQQKEDILGLWNTEYPASLGHAGLSDFERYLSALSDAMHYMSFNEVGSVIAWAFAFTREKQRWFAIIVDSNRQRSGVRTRMLEKIKSKETLLYAWVMDHNNAVRANGELYMSPLALYEKNEFDVCRGVRLETEKLSAVKIRWKRV